METSENLENLYVVNVTVDLQKSTPRFADSSNRVCSDIMGVHKWCTCDTLEDAQKKVDQILEILNNNFSGQKINLVFENQM